jgi:hypothetical protein
MRIVRTVNGDIAPAELGVTQTHEHLRCDQRLCRSANGFPSDTTLMVLTDTDLRGADAAGGARLVLDDDDGAEPLLQPGLHESRNRIDRAAGRERNDDPGDVARGGLAEGRLSERHRRGAEHERAARDRGHGVSPWAAGSHARRCRGHPNRIHRWQ